MQKSNKQIYIDRLADNMLSSGQHNWLKNDMQDLCELAGLFEQWLNTHTKEQEEELTIKASKILNVRIC